MSPTPWNRRHPALVPYTSDHHHGLAESRRLKLAAGGGAAERVAAASRFCAFFREDAARHFADEEAHLLPALMDKGLAERAMMVTILEEHIELRELVDELARGARAGDVDAHLMRKVAGAFGAHIRLEERRLFPMLQRIAPAVLDSIA
ncbi:MAG: hypothetical protein GEU78_11810 [Actinobacteria bacterium]|nr:hypothetical protein [Actinomycetota bacterium]